MRRRLLIVSRAKALSITKWESWAAVKQARKVGQTYPAAVRICWDLDNTLANSGALIHVGERLQDAIVEVQPVPNMVAFYEAMRMKLRMPST